MSRVTNNFKQEFEAILAEEGKHPYNEILRRCLHSMREHKLLYVLEKVDCSQFLVHRKNRGGLLLSPHNVHKNAEKIHRVGAGKRKNKQLANALCIELAPEGSRREDNLATNTQLVERAEGLLAGINGSERFFDSWLRPHGCFLQVGEARR